MPLPSLPGPPGPDRPRAPSAPERPSWRRVVLPTEHGGWAFLGEPILLGLAVAFSVPGLLVGVAGIAAFLARQPLKLFVSDRRRGKRYPRTVLAGRAFAACALFAAASIAGALTLARGPLLLALGLMAPLAAAGLAFDLGRRSREAAAELVSVLALGGLSAAIALAAGLRAAPSLGLWGFLATRSVPSILYVRARLRLDRGEPARTGMAFAAHGAGLAFAALLASRALVPWLGVAAIALLGLRSLYGLSARRPRWTTPQLGASEIVFGLVCVLAVVLGLRLRG